MTRVAIGAILATMLHAAQAREPARHWYVIDFAEGLCIQPPAATPDQFRAVLRAEGRKDITQTYKRANGTVNSVSMTVSDNGRIITLWWYPTEALCEVGLSEFRESGVLPDRVRLQ